ncbi:MAG: peptidylprolyl isomerase [Polyangiaceae bacterium]|nr:peptidylprolyl isomerase [Polyangiaceae bacterium]
MRTPAPLIAVLALAIGACSEEPAAPTPAAPEAPAARTPTQPGSDEPAPNAFPDEACLQGVLVSYQGAASAAESVTRSKEEARERATELRERVAGGEDIASVAREEGDGGRAARGGQLGTFPKSEWPALYAPLKEPAFALPVGGLSDLVEAPFGYVFFERCPVEKVHTRHILIRYAGAHNAPADLTRSKEEARSTAQRLRREAAAPGADFASLARESSEDGSAAQGGDIGLIARGLLEPEYEQAAFALAPGQIAEVVETRVGFHVIQRIGD